MTGNNSVTVCLLTTVCGGRLLTLFSQQEQNCGEKKRKKRFSKRRYLDLFTKKLTSIKSCHTLHGKQQKCYRIKKYSLNGRRK